LSAASRFYLAIRSFGVSLAGIATGAFTWGWG